MRTGSLTAATLSCETYMYIRTWRDHASTYVYILYMHCDKDWDMIYCVKGEKINSIIMHYLWLSLHCPIYNDSLDGLCSALTVIDRMKM